MIYVVILPAEMEYNYITFKVSLLVMNSFSVSTLKRVNYVQRQIYLHIDFKVIDSFYLKAEEKLTQTENANSTSLRFSAIQK